MRFALLFLCATQAFGIIKTTGMLDKTKPATVTVVVAKENLHGKCLTKENTKDQEGVWEGKELTDVKDILDRTLEELVKPLPDSSTDVTMALSRHLYNTIVDCAKKTNTFTMEGVQYEFVKNAPTVQLQRMANGTDFPKQATDAIIGNFQAIFFAAFPACAREMGISLLPPRGKPSITAVTTLPNRPPPSTDPKYDPEKLKPTEPAATATTAPVTTRKGEILLRPGAIVRPPDEGSIHDLTGEIPPKKIPRPKDEGSLDDLK